MATHPFIFSSGGVYQWGVYDEHVVYLDWDEVKEGGKFGARYAENMIATIVATYGEEPENPEINNILGELREELADIKREL